VFDFDPGNVVGTVEPIAPRIEAGTIDHAAALEISRANSVDYFVVAEPAAMQAPYRVAAERLHTDARLLFVRRTKGRPPRVMALVGGSSVEEIGAFEDAPTDEPVGSSRRS
jgi:hypothetical protein